MAFYSKEIKLTIDGVEKTGKFSFQKVTLRSLSQMNQLLNEMTEGHPLTSDILLSNTMRTIVELKVAIVDAPDWFEMESLTWTELLPVWGAYRDWSDSFFRKEVKQEVQPSEAVKK